MPNNHVGVSAACDRRPRAVSAGFRFFSGREPPFVSTTGRHHAKEHTIHASRRKTPGLPFGLSEAAVCCVSSRSWTRITCRASMEHGPGDHWSRGSRNHFFGWLHKKAVSSGSGLRARSYVRTEFSSTRASIQIRDRGRPSSYGFSFLPAEAFSDREPD